MKSSPRALIVGSTGQLGRALLQRAPADLHCIGISRQELDLTDEGAIRDVVAVHAPNLLINAAAYTAVDRAESEPDTAFAVNARAVGALSEAGRACGAHFVHVSTDFVFDGNSSQAYKPEDERNPLSVYGRSKADGEDAAGPLATIVRTSWVYGRQGANFVNTMLRVMRSQHEVRVVSDQIGSPTWVTGLASTVWQLGIGQKTGIWHHTDAGVATWYDFAVAIEEEANRLGLLEARVNVVPISTADYPTPARRPRFSLLDSSQTRKELGESAVHWRAHLIEMLEEVARDQLSVDHTSS